MSRVPNRVTEHKDYNKQEIKDNQNYKIYSDRNGRYAPKAVKGKQDPFWYAVDATAVANMASFPWTEVVGTPISKAKTDVLPGIAVYRYMPTVGSFQNEDNVNLLDRTATAFFNYTVQGFTGGVDFQASDLLMSEIAAASLFAALIEGKRTYGILSYYLQLNKYYARNICRALGFNFDDLTSNLANFRMRWNMYAQEFNKTIPLAKSFAISDRWDYINSFIFTDTSSPEYSTASVYVPHAYLKYDATTAKTGTCLRWEYKHDYMSVDDYFEMIENLFDALNDDDVRSMFGAVRRVYDQGNFKVLNEIDPSFVTPVIQNDVVAGALHNAEWINRNDFYYAALLPEDYSADGNEYLDVACYQDNNGRILSLPVVSSGTPYQSFEQNVLNYLSNKDEYLFDCYDSLNTPSNVLDMTVNMQMIGPKYDEIETSEGSDVHSRSRYRVICRSEMLIGVELWGEFAYSVINSETEFNYSHLNKVIDSDTLNGSNIIPLMHLSHVDSHPLIEIVQGTSQAFPADALQLGYLGEIDRYTYLSRRDLSNIHQQSFWKMLMMPANTKSTTK